jgi:hypothetical protein
MTCLEIKALIRSSKLREFNQSKLAFIDKLQQTNGYIGFTEKQGDYFQIEISWEARKSLDKFIKSEYYRIFRGAIITLGQITITRIFEKVEKQLLKQNKK